MEKWSNALYRYCTDFCINMANLLDISYVEFNMCLFIIGLPLLFVVLLLVNAYRYLFRTLWTKRGVKA